MKVKVLENILTANDRVAEENRRLLDADGVYCINLMASPGAGKTTFIIEMIRHLAGTLRIGVVEADLASSVDAEKVGQEGVPVLQINTGGGCHLNANQLTPALRTLPLRDIDVLIVATVGNLVCTAGYDLGEHLKLVLASVPEGHDKPYKYPKMFHVVSTVVITKADLKPYIPFDGQEFRKAVAGINPDARIFEVSCVTHEGIGEWCEWLTEQVKATVGHG